MSEVKVNKISPRTNCGTVTVGDSGDSVTVSSGVPVTVSNNLTVSGDLKSAALKATDGGSIISQSGTTITLGASGDTVSLASGASQTGFGRTGTVDWDTTVKTSGFTAADGEGYFVNTTSGAITANLPAGSAGAIVAFKDYANTWNTNALTLTPNGSDKVNGVNANAVLDTEDQSVTLVFVDSTKGWRAVQDSTSTVDGASFITATGGTITTSGNCKIHTFTGPGTFTVCSVATESANNEISYLVVAGGGSGGTLGGGGGGAGGFRESKSPVTPYTASPLDGRPSAPNRITVTAQGYPITVGGGGSSSPTSPTAPGNTGSNSTFSTITSAGGGFGGGNKPAGDGGDGGSGGGGNGGSGSQNGGTGNTPPTSPAQGKNGGGTPSCGAPNKGSGGGGATTVGASGGPGPGQGGTGATTSISASPTAYAGGAGGGSGGIPSNNCNGAGSSCGTGGVGGNGGSPAPTPSMQGTTNRGGGGGGGEQGEASGAGGSGIVIIRYKFQ
jgi:hypothetical protein